MRTVALLTALLITGLSPAAFAQGIFDFRYNKISRVSMPVTNYGIYGMDAHDYNRGIFWPRGTENRYLFAAGMWFGAKKPNPSWEGKQGTYVEISYNVSNGKSWMSPGRIEDNGTSVSDSIKKYQIHSSTDFRADGTPLGADSELVWPVWRSGRTFGSYVHDPAQRNSSVFLQGPAFVSDEDITTVFKDTDLKRYDGGAVAAKEYGYPLQVQYEQSIYGWREGHPLQDAIVIRYTLINFSPDTLRECWFAPVLETDIVYGPISYEGVINDRVDFIREKDSLSMAIAWTMNNWNEAGKGFGYLGTTFLESPAVDKSGFIRRDKNSYSFQEQLGIRTFKNWSITEDFVTEAARYATMSSGIRDGDNGAGDKRMMIATGPFSMRPGDTAVIAMGLAFAMPSKGGDADGSPEDITGIIGGIKTLRNYYQSGLTINSVDENALGGIEASISPQPASSSATLRVSSQDEKNITVSLFSSLGERIATVYEGAIVNETKFFTIDTGSLPSGLYFLRISGQGGIPFRIVH